MSEVSAKRTTAAAPAESRSLSGHTTLRLGGAADRLVTAGTAEEIVQNVREAHARGDELLILAGGSNVVIGDIGFPGTVVLVRSQGVRLLAEESDSVTVRVAAGEPWDAFVQTAVVNGWSGIECLSGVPGSAGATPIQNVGAYGQEVAESIAAVEVYDQHNQTIDRIVGADCGFAYRSSVFRHNRRWVVLSVDFRLTRSPLSGPVRYAELARALDVEVGGRVRLDEARTTVLALRSSKGMVLDENDLDTWSVGSFFTNPVIDAGAYDLLRERAGALGEPPAWPGAGEMVKISAAWLIERAGFRKGHQGAGGVAISSKHTLALTNRGSGSTDALVALARQIRDGVHDRFGVTLYPEPVLVNCVI